MTGNSQTIGVSSQVEQLMEMAMKAIGNADADAASAHVEGMRTQRPMDTDVDLVESLIKSKTMQTGLVGAVTSAGSVIPGFGTLASFTLGVATDVGMTLKMQSELVMEIAAVHGHDLSQQERRNAMMMVTGVNLGSERLANQASRKLAQKVTERFAGRAFVKVIPFVGIAASAGANMVTTYTIGKRAEAYFSLGPNSDRDRDESFRALSGLDERKLVDRLSEVMADLGQGIGDGAQRAGRTAAHLGRATSAAAAGGFNALRERTARRALRRSQRRQQPDSGYPQNDNAFGEIPDDQTTD